MADLDPRTAMGPVHLTIADLGRSVDFYHKHLGVVPRTEDGRTAHLGTMDRDLIVLTESSAARRAPRTTGLYHFAILVPSRLELAQSLRHLVDTGTSLQGFADHGVSEAIYLADPDGNGIEIYRDRPRSEWPIRNGHLQMGADPLDTDDLLRELEREEPWAARLSAQTIIGHMHLHVRDLAEAEQFYVNAIGFDLVQRYGQTALFVSAGGYHHHVGLNTWAGVGAPPAPPGAIGLRHFVVHVPDQTALTQVTDRLQQSGVPFESIARGILVRDPSSNAIAFEVD